MIIPAPEFHVYRCFGDDAEAFLQNQFTGDVCTISEGGWSLSGYCSPKGRLLALFFVCRRENEFLVSTHGSLAEHVIARLRMYVMRADVSFELLNDQHLAFHDKRANGADGLKSSSEPFSLQNLLDVSTIDAVTTDEAGKTAAFHALCIELGLPLISAPLSEALIPQSVNLDLVGGVSFKKGCYPGQEIVARVRYRGKPKQRMIRAVAEHTQLPEPGTALKCTPTKSGRDGVVICAAVDHTCDEIQLLAAVPTEAITPLQSGGLSWEDVPLTVSPLPYPIPAEDLD